MNNNNHVKSGVMNVDICLASFERLLDLLDNTNDEDMLSKLEAVINAFPWPTLTRKQEWRLNQLRSELQQRITLIQNNKIDI